MKESNKQTLAMAQQTIKDMAAQMTSLVNAVAESKKVAIKQEEGDKENSPPNGRQGAQRRGMQNMIPKLRNKKYRAEPKLCKNCNRMVKHHEKDCMELESNKHLRPDNWRSCKK